MNSSTDNPLAASNPAGKQNSTSSIIQMKTAGLCLWPSNHGMDAVVSMAKEMFPNRPEWGPLVLGVYGQGNISRLARVESPVLLHADRGRAEDNSTEAAGLLIKEKGKDVMWGRQPLSTTVRKTISRKMDQGTLAATVGLRDMTVTSSLHPPLADPHPIFFPTWGSSHRVEDVPPKTNHLQFAPQSLKNSSPCPSNLSWNLAFSLKTLLTTLPNFPKSYYFPLPGTYNTLYVHYLHSSVFLMYQNYLVTHKSLLFYTHSHTHLHLTRLETVWNQRSAFLHSESLICSLTYGVQKCWVNERMYESLL